MRHIQLAIILFSIITTTCALGFSGKLVNIPERVSDIPKDVTTSAKIPNIQNLAYRTRVDLYSLNDSKDTKGFKPQRALVDKNNNFVFEGLNEGEYQLIVNSYDVTFHNNIYRIKVGDDEIIAFENPLGYDSYNTSSATKIDHDKPLQLRYKETKQFYERSGGTLVDMAMNSPFGFIFKNRMYTILFTVCLAIMAAPYVLQWINPELAAELNEAKVQMSNERQGGESARRGAMGQEIPIEKIESNQNYARSGKISKRRP